MSLRINIDNVDAVLLADGWHKVIMESFDLDAYEFVDGGGVLVHGGGHSNVSATGFSFLSELPPISSIRIAGPLTAIIAVAYR